MLKLENIVKNYSMGDTQVKALKGVNIEFRESEFVSILGPSGCGKTTLLNIIGGLDRYTSGDLVVGDTSTKNFRDKDWDAYRNHTIGFVFQNYNLISHQTVLDNVAIALTLSGVGAKQRREKALAALEKVGIADQAHKKPNQLSGGQMQRVAIARALINNPQIILADEPTGALDTQTSEQIMNILKDVAKDRLVIMVTHNPELAEQYSTRIVRLLDGEVIQDTNPKTQPAPTNASQEQNQKSKTSMSYTTALKLSFKNLLTKKTRTILTAIAGSIGIIGVALVLALSAGMNAYIEQVQSDTLASFPIRISQYTTISEQDEHSWHQPNESTYPTSGIFPKQENYEYHVNDFNTAFQTYVDTAIKPKELAHSITYNYSTQMNLLFDMRTASVPTNTIERLNYTSDNSFLSTMMSSGASNTIMFQQLPTVEDFDTSFLATQYDTIAKDETRTLDTNEYELTLVVDENNITDTTLLKKLHGSNDTTNMDFSYDDMFNFQFKIAYNDAVINTSYSQLSFDSSKYQSAYDSAEITLYITRIIRLKKDAPAALLTPGLAYPEQLIKNVTEHEHSITGGVKDIVSAETAQPTSGALTKPTTKLSSSLLFSLSNATQATFMDTKFPIQKQNMIISKIFAIDTSPSEILFYSKNFDTKNQIKTLLDDYNNLTENKENPENQILYTDLAEMFTKMIKTLIDTISLVLTAFAAISLVVSTIMIGIITYVSVVERTKEIGILRSIGARKKDISRVFNAETLIIGFTAGVIGIFTTLILSFPINRIVERLSGVTNITALPIISAIALIITSCTLTLIAGLIPSRMAAKKDPVTALRTE